MHYQSLFGQGCKQMDNCHQSEPKLHVLNVYSCGSLGMRILTITVKIYITEITIAIIVTIFLFRIRN